MVVLTWLVATPSLVAQDDHFRFESVSLTNSDAPITLQLAYRPDLDFRHPVILMLGSLKTNELPAWSPDLVREGYMLAAFSAAYPPDPDPARRAQWLYFDERFAHSYVLGAQRAIVDSRRVMDYLTNRADVLPDKIGWLGSSSTGIPGLAVATQGPRLAAVVAFVSTGAYQKWFDTWQPNGLWRGTNYSLWPETVALLKQYDPILHADGMFPTAVLMVSGGDDKVVDPKTAREFVNAVRPFYNSDPERLRLVVYEGFGHNLPTDVVRLYAEHWFHLYLSPSNSAPASANAPGNLEQSVVRSQINAADHRQIVGAAPALEWIQVSSDHRGFVTSPSNRKFIPWGFNYDRDFKMRLIEDYWLTEWETVAGDFREMKALGANVVRIHLSLGRFMEAANAPNPKAFDHLARLVKLAEETGLYLDVTGLGAYRKSDVPAWYDQLNEPDRWRVQARFWEAAAERCSTSPAIFCYDLMNEPIVPYGKRLPHDWLAGELAGFNYVQFISLDQEKRTRSDIARQWIANLVSAIRKHDTRHLVTVGMLPNSLDGSSTSSGFIPKKVATDLDFISVHLYPRSGKLDSDLKLLRGFQIGKPVVIEEIFPMYCKVPELRNFIELSRKDAAGWLGFYWGQTPDDLSQSSNKGAALTRAWLGLFQEMNPN